LRLDPVVIRLATTPGRYLTGEESALVHWLNGGEAKPTFVPPRPFEKGVGGRPTLVQNVETLAHLALIGRFGADWFRSVGTGPDPGSALVTVSGAVTRPGVQETPLGTPLVSLLDTAGASSAVQAVLVGGYFGTWLPASAVASAVLSPRSLGPAGPGMGCGAIVALPAPVCGAAESARVARWLADQTAGQCGPCVHGLDAIARAMAALVSGDWNGHAQAQLERWLEMIKGRGACKHPDGAARFVESSLLVFADEISRHRRQGPCPAANQAAFLPLPTAGAWR
jgi:NADH:ubiquinone oxidoreductase subunit F (NADH-binding)